MLITDYTHYNYNSLLEAELRIKERWKKNKINLKFNKKDKILIFGTLNYSKAILDLGSSSIYAVDNCEKPWFYKTKKYSKINYKKINLNTKLNYKKESFDFIFCNGILTHLNNWELHCSKYNLDELNYPKMIVNYKTQRLKSIEMYKGK